MRTFMPPFGIVILSFTFFLGCDSSSADNPVDANESQPGGQFSGIGVHSNVPPIGEGTPSDASAPDASPVESDALGDEDGESKEEVPDALSPADEDTAEDSLSPPLEDTGSGEWEGMEGIEGTLVLFDVDSSFADANVATLSGYFGAPEATDTVISEYGNCQVVLSNGAGSIPQNDSLDAGLVVFSGLAVDANLTYTETADGPRYVSSIGESFPDIFLPGGGSSIGVSSEGGVEFPAFSLTLATPDPVTILSPDLSGNDSIDPDAAFSLTWAPGTHVDFINVFLAGVNATGDVLEGPTVSCTLEGDPGALTIPAEAMQALPKESSLFGSGYILVGVSRGTIGTSVGSPLPVSITALRSTGGIVANN